MSDYLHKLPPHSATYVHSLMQKSAIKNDLTLGNYFSSKGYAIGAIVLSALNVGVRGPIEGICHPLCQMLNLRPVIALKVAANCAWGGLKSMVIIALGIIFLAISIFHPKIFTCWTPEKPPQLFAGPNLTKIAQALNVKPNKENGNEYEWPQIHAALAKLKEESMEVIRKSNVQKELIENCKTYFRTENGILISDENLLKEVASYSRGFDGITVLLADAQGKRLHTIADIEEAIKRLKDLAQPSVVLPLQASQEAISS